MEKRTLRLIFNELSFILQVTGGVKKYPVKKQNSHIAALGAAKTKAVIRYSKLLGSRQGVCEYVRRVVKGELAGKGGNMPNKKTRALTEETYLQIIRCIREGFVSEDGKWFRPNERLAVILNLEANLGLRISDVLHLHLSDIVKDGERYRLDVIEQKTKKPRTFTVPIEIYSYLQEYALEHGIQPSARLFTISVRAVQKQLKLAADYLRLEGVSTHSFRKYFATDIYVRSDYNIELVRVLLQHTSVITTQRYIGIQAKEIEAALQEHVKIV